MKPTPVTFDLPALVRALWRRRVALIQLHAAVAVVTVIAVLVMPRWYASSVTLVPAPAEGFSLDISGLVTGLPSSSFDFGSGPTPQDQLLLVATSRSVADSMVDRFELVKRWDLKRRDQAREQLAASTAFITPREGHVIITVEAETARLAQEMAAAYATLSARESARLRTSLAAQRRQYLEVRLAEIDREAALAASRMRAFEERHGAVSLPDQARETMSAGAQLQAQVAMLETELAAARSYYTDRSPQVRILRERIAEMKRQVEHLARQGGTMRVAGTDLPALKQEYLHLTQEQASLAEVSAALRRLYEQSRVEEANPVPSFAVLDAAELPERHAGPKRVLTVAIALTLCAAFTTGWVFLAENHFLPARVAGWGLPRGGAADPRVTSDAESEPGQKRRAA